MTILITKICNAGNCPINTDIIFVITGLKNLDFVQQVQGNFQLESLITDRSSNIQRVDFFQGTIETYLGQVAPLTFNSIKVYESNPVINGISSLFFEFETNGNIFSGSYIEISSPPNTFFPNFDVSNSKCVGIIEINAVLACLSNNNILRINNGFSSNIAASFIRIGVLLVTNPSNAQNYGFGVTIKTAAGFVTEATTTSKK